MGLAAGLGLGFLVVLIFEILDGRMHSEKEIKDLLPTVILAEIPQVLSERDKQTIKRNTVLSWAVTAAALVIVLAGSAFSYIKN